MKAAIDGQRFGILTVLASNPSGSRKKIRTWACLCDCGGITNVSTGSLRNGNTKSCGCLKHVPYAKTHGMSGTQTYRSWLNMSQRCGNPNHPRFADYGGRGITVCARWKSFDNFLMDMGVAPSSKRSVERRDNQQGYKPSNCHWGTDREQANNKRNNHMLTFKGKTQSMAAWAEEMHLRYTTLRRRCNTGWSDEKALTTPIRSIQFRLSTNA